MRVLVINCGSTTLKYKLLEESAGELKLLAGDTQDIADGYRAAVERGNGGVTGITRCDRPSRSAWWRTIARSGPH